jgi:chemotaxis signal transduction protein
MELFTFRAGGKKLGLNAGHIYRIVDELRITPVPLTPTCHLGIIYYRGELFQAVDLSALISSNPCDHGGSPRFILIKWADKKLALVPDAIDGLIWFDEKGNGTKGSENESAPVERLTPEKIWTLLSELSYGFSKISKDFQPGI